MPSQDENERVNIGYRGTEEFRRRLQIEAIERGMKVQTLIDAAINFYLEHNPSVPEGARAGNG